MEYKQELSFLFDVFKKTHLGSGVIQISEITPEAIKRKIPAPLIDAESIAKLLSEMSRQTVYRFTDRFSLGYCFLLLDDAETPSAMYAGPYLSAALSDTQLSELCEKNNVSPQKRKYLTEYYSSLVVLPQSSPIFTMLQSFCERAWRRADFAVKDVTDMNTEPPSESPFTRSMLALEPNDALVNMRAIERRYDFENEMMRSVSLGQLHMENKFRQAFGEGFFEKRAADPLRNAKNYGVIMNTLLRKAAESGGVHPVYLDQVSSDFAYKIEDQVSLSENAPLMLDMFRTYCRLVRTHSLQGFSALVQKAILIIESDLSTDLSPKLLSANLGVSLGYLSTVFSRETGTTLSAYIRAKRIEYAEYLLRKSDLQIQNVALHCGIMDVQYFTKIFKKHTGRTPSEYRKMSKAGKD